MDQHFYLPSTTDGLRLSTTMITPSGTPRGIVQLVHGMCDHKERYFSFMRFLCSHQFVCIIHDQRGHGDSVAAPDDLGYMYSGGMKALIEDVRTVNSHARQQYPKLPLALLGHSMGSMVVRSYVKRYPESIDSLIICGCPSYNPALPIAQLLALCVTKIMGSRHRSRLLHALSFGAFNRHFRHEQSEYAWVCSNPETLKAYESDPKCTFRFTANGYENLFALMRDCYSPQGWKIVDPDMPVHFISGADDPCRISDKAFHRAVDFMLGMGYRNTSEKLYPGMRHEILNETDREKVWDDILDILK